jgi:hypothetical protein
VFYTEKLSFAVDMDSLVCQSSNPGRRNNIRMNHPPAFLAIYPDRQHREYNRGVSCSWRYACDKTRHSPVNHTEHERLLHFYRQKATLTSDTKLPTFCAFLGVLPSPIPKESIFLFQCIVLLLMIYDILH